MSTIPQLRRDINDLREKLRAVEAERDALRARPKPAPIVKEVVKRVAERVEVPGPERVVVKRVEVPGPERVVMKRVEVPSKEQAAKIAELESKLATFAQYDMTAFKKWQKMVAVAKGR